MTPTPFLAATAASLLTALLGAALDAQEPVDAAALDAAATLPRQRIPVHTAAADEGVDYGVWAAGVDYKASFHDGMTFVPYLGSEYPRTVTFRWRTRGVEVGGVLETAVEPHATLAPYRVEYDLGSVVEAYDVREDGLEQTFVLHRPLGRGELVVRGVVETPLVAPDVAAAHQELLFRDAEGRAIVRYGAATAVDALGRTQPMRTCCSGNEVTLHLDGDWLAQAAYPVVVDPIIAGGGVLPVGSPVVAVDAVRDDRQPLRNVWIAYVLAASASDQDLVVVRTNDVFNAPVTIFPDLTSSWSTFEPSAGYNPDSDRCLVASTRHFVATQNRRVRAHLHAGDDLDPSTSALFLPAVADQQFWRPEVGGTRSTVGGSQTLVVMQRESGISVFGNTTTSEIAGCVLDTIGNGSIGPVFTIVDAGGFDAERPVVNQVDTASSNNEWLLVYQQRSLFAPADTSWSLYARKVREDGTFTAPHLLGGNSFTQHLFAAEVAGGDGRYVVSYVGSPVSQVPNAPAGSIGYSVRSLRIDWPHGSASATEHGVSILNSNNDARVQVVGASFDSDTRSHFGVLYRSSVTQNLYFAVAGHNGAPLRTTTVGLPAGNPSTVGGSVCYDDDNDRHILHYAYDQSVVQALYGYETAPLWSTSGIGCSTGTIGWQGSQQIGSEFSGVYVDGLPAGSLKALILGYASVDQLLVGIPPVQPGCWLLVPNAGAGYLTVLGGGPGTGSLWTLPLPENLPSFPLYAQCFHTDATGTMLQSTKRLRVDLVK